MDRITRPWLPAVLVCASLALIVTVLVAVSLSTRGPEPDTPLEGVVTPAVPVE